MLIKQYTVYTGQNACTLFKNVCLGNISLHVLLEKGVLTTSKTGTKIAIDVATHMISLEDALYTKTQANLTALTYRKPEIVTRELTISNMIYTVHIVYLI